MTQRQSLARRYRPRTFSELVGQDSLVRILSHSIDKGIYGQAYLLTGIRGCGKTSTARIIAMALNCDEGPSSTPNLDSPSCKAILSNQASDVIEIDAASHTGVDDVRAIIESVGYKPMHMRHKIIIIDEVHMLSRSAFNALLKTLEEPPEHAVFILATTEFRKVPATIVSRCQRFDLKRISISDLKTRVQDILKSENIEMEEGAIEIIVRAGDGSMRDTLSILDQAIAGDMKTEVDVRGMIGLAAKGVSSRLTALALEGKGDAALGLAKEAIYGGADAVQIIKDMMDIIHAGIVLKASPKTDLSSTYTPREIELARNIPGNVESVGTAWKIALSALEDAKISPAPAQSLDMAIIRIALRAKPV